MSAITYEGHVENGQIRLERDVRLPEKAKVYVVVPGADGARVVRLPSPRLVRPQDAECFRKEVTEEPPRAKV